MSELLNKKTRSLPNLLQSAQKQSKLIPLFLAEVLQQISLNIEHGIRASVTAASTFLCDLCQHSPPIGRIKDALNQPLRRQAIYHLGGIRANAARLFGYLPQLQRFPSQYKNLEYMILRTCQTDRLQRHVEARLGRPLGSIQQTEQTHDPFV